MSSAHRVAFGFLFFLSGALGLIYEVLWQRALSLSFGVTGFAIAIILAAYMSGLALGTWIGGRLAPRIPRPALAYGALEVGIGLYALILPALMSGATSLYRLAYLGLDPGPVTFGMIQGGILLVILLVPTTAMGATFPLLVEVVVPGDRAAGSRVGWLYAANCGGAVLGTLLCGFILLPEVGHLAATRLAAAGSVSVGILAWLLSRAVAAADWRAELDIEAPPPPPTSPLTPALSWLLAAVAASGAAAMIYEVAWTRLLALQLGSSVYAFTTMLATFLLGLALGGGLASAALRVWPAVGAAGFMVAQGLGLVGVGVSTMLLPELPPTVVQLHQAFGPGGTAFWVQLTVAAAVMLPPTVMMGAALPFAMAAASGGQEDVTPRVARVYVASTAGSVAGTLAAGFGLLPALGVQGTIGLGMGVGAVGLLAVALPPAPWLRRAAWVSAVAAVAALGLRLQPPWDPLLMAAGLYKHVDDLKDADREDIVKYTHRNLDLLYYGEGLSSAVTVGRSRSSGALWLANNGKVDASSEGDLSTQLMLAHLPMFTHPDPREVAVIGLASGITSGGITRYPIERLDVLEIERHIVAASHFFDEHNDRPLEDPRVHLHLADARNHLLLTDDAWDVIVSEPSNPWISGVNNLFTREFFELASARLKPGGLLCQWVQLYELAPRDLVVLLRTFHSVFPEVILYWSVGDGDLIMVGSHAPLRLDPDRVQRLLADPGVAASLARIDVDDRYDLISWYHMGTAELEAMVGDGTRLNTDDNAHIEFRAPLFLGLDTSTVNSRELMTYRSGAESLIIDQIEDPAQHLALAEAYLKRNLFGLSRAALERYVATGGDLDTFFAVSDRVDAAYEDYPYVDPSTP